MTQLWIRMERIRLLSALLKKEQNAYRKQRLEVILDDLVLMELELQKITNNKGGGNDQYGK